MYSIYERWVALQKETCFTVLKLLTAVLSAILSPYGIVMRIN